MADTCPKSLPAGANDNQPDATHHVATLDGYDHLAQQTKNGDWGLSLRVTGAHCAGCIQKIEGAVKQIEGVSHARLNFTTQRMEVHWHAANQSKGAGLANDIASRIAGLGYHVSPLMDAQADDNSELTFLIRSLGVAGFAAGNIMLLSIGLWAAYGSDMGEATRSFMHWISGIIAVPCILYAGRPFFKSAWAALKNRSTNMDLPISLALILSLAVSIMEALRQGPHVYFDSAAMLCFFLLIGRTLDMRARHHARQSASDLLGTLSGFATRITADGPDQIPIRDIQPGMELLVAAGEKIPADGHVIKGHTELNTALITGESLPVAASMGAEVHAGTVNLGQPITICADKISEDSLLSDIVRLMELAEQGRAKYVRLADRAAQLYTPVVHCLALAAFLFWWLVMGMAWQPALMIAVSVLIITCPCALGLAVPVVQVLATGQLFRRGILVKSGDALERLANADTALIDKTGTLTHGTPQLTNTPNTADLQLAASLAVHSKHPLARAVAAAYEGPLLAIDHVAEQAGAGLTGKYNNKPVKLGSRAFVGEPDGVPPGGPEVWLQIADYSPRVLQFADILRSDAAAVVAALKVRDFKTAILSGDRQSVVRDVASQLQIDVSHAEITPDEKYQLMQNMRAEGRRTLMVGDGLNDAAVLRGADISIAPGTAIDMAQASADIVFMGNKLSSVIEAIDVARLSSALIKQNFALAIIYNLVAIPMAFAGEVTPLIAALAMSGSSLVVIANSFRLKWGRSQGLAAPSRLPLKNAPTIPAQEHLA